MGRGGSSGSCCGSVSSNRLSSNRGPVGSGERGVCRSGETREWMVIISDGIADLSLHNLTQKAKIRRRKYCSWCSGVGREGGERNQREGGG